jgi:hypothetical protein
VLRPSCSRRLRPTQHIEDIAELIAPQRRFCLIDDPSGFDIMKFKGKAVSIHHELMFTRAIYAGHGRNRLEFSTKCRALR